MKKQLFAITLLAMVPAVMFAPAGGRRAAPARVNPVVNPPAGDKQPVTGGATVTTASALLANATEQDKADAAAAAVAAGQTLAASGNAGSAFGQATTKLITTGSAVVPSAQGMSSRKMGRLSK